MARGDRQGKGGGKKGALDHGKLLKQVRKMNETSARQHATSGPPPTMEDILDHMSSVKEQERMNKRMRKRQRAQAQHELRKQWVITHGKGVAHDVPWQDVKAVDPAVSRIMTRTTVPDMSGTHFVSVVRDPPGDVEAWRPPTQFVEEFEAPDMAASFRRTCIAHLSDTAQKIRREYEGITGRTIRESNLQAGYGKDLNEIEQELWRVRMTAKHGRTRAAQTR